MTKIFITIPWFLPAFRAGGPMQSIANLVKEFHEDVEYYIYTSDTDLNGAALESVKTGEWVDYNDHTKIWYAEPGKISDSLVKQVEAIKPDVLYIVGIYSWHFNMVPLIYCKAPRKILSAREMVYAGALSQKNLKRKIYLKTFKLLKYHHKNFFQVAGEEEYKYMNNYFGDAAKIFIAGAFPDKPASIPVLEKEKGSLRLVCITVISPVANILEMLHALEKSGALIQCDIYGPVMDHDYMRICRQQVKKLPKNISVVWHGDTGSSKIAELLAQSHVYVLPGDNENYWQAMCEALSAGRPVINIGPTHHDQLKESGAGLHVSPSDVEALRNAIGFFADMNQQELDTWSKNAHEYSVRSFNAVNVKKQYEEMFGLQSDTETIQIAGNS